jgi:hypothetical protein
MVILFSLSLRSLSPALWALPFRSAKASVVFWYESFECAKDEWPFEGTALHFGPEANVLDCPGGDVAKVSGDEAMPQTIHVGD